MINWRDRCRWSRLVFHKNDEGRKAEGILKVTMIDEIYSRLLSENYEHEKLVKIIFKIIVHIYFEIE